MILYLRTQGMETIIELYSSQAVKLQIRVQSNLKQNYAIESQQVDMSLHETKVHKIIIVGAI